MKRKVVLTLLCGILAISSMTACGGAKETVAEVATTTETTEESEEDVKAAEEAAAKEAEEKAAEEAAAKEAEKEEAYETGRACLYGLDGQEIDLETAYNSFEKALELGKTEANFYLGVMYDWESYPEQDFEKARTYYEAAGENPYAYVALGFNYYFGQGVEADQEKGKEYFDKAIALGCMDGYYGLGQIASEEGDLTTAMEDYEMAAEKGAEPLYMGGAMSQIGRMYYLGIGAEQDYVKAAEWYEKAANQGNVEAMTLFASLCLTGTGTEENEMEAAKWLQKAADLGDTYAMLWLGQMNYDANNMEKAVEWYQKAAEQGNINAMNELANMYENGLGVDQDAEKAAEWYAKAEEAAEN